MKLSSKLCHAGLAALLGLVFVRDAHALSCDEIMNMVNVNVPVPIVVQTIEDSGEQFSNDEIRCLMNEGAPAEVIDAAKKLMAGAEPEEVQRGETEVARPSRRESCCRPRSGGGWTAPSIARWRIWSHSSDRTARSPRASRPSRR